MNQRSIYDSYRLSNSSAIPLYEGSAGSEAIQVGQYLQGQYNIAAEGAGQVSSATQNIMSMPQDQGHADELRNTTNQKIQDMTNARDWENRVMEVNSLGRNFANRAMDLQKPVQQYQAWMKDELDDKEKNLTSDQKDALQKMALANYKGLKKDASGKLVGTFSGGRVAKNIDVAKKADEWIKGTIEQEGGTDISTDNGIVKYRKAGTWHVLTGDRIKRILADGRATDKEYQDYAEQEGSISGFHGTNITDLKQLDKQPSMKNAVMGLMKNGYTLQEATSMALKEGTRTGIATTMDDYAVTKYAHNNRTSVSSSGIGEFALAKKVKELDDFRIMGAGANTAPSWAVDPDKLTNEIKSGEDNIKKLTEEKAVQERLLKSSPNDIGLQTGLDRIKKQIDMSQKVLDGSKAIWDNTRNQAVQDLKLDDGKGNLIGSYKQFQESMAPQVYSKIHKEFPNGLDIKGKHYTPGELTIRAFRGQTVANGLFGFGDKPNPDDKTPPTMAERKYAALVQNEFKILSKIDTRAHEIHKDAVKNYSTTANAVGLNESEQNAIGDFGVSSGTIYSAPGSNKVYSDNDVRGMRFVPEKFNVETGRITGKFKDDKGKLTESMDVEMNTNLMSELRTRLAKNNVDGKWNTVLGSMDDFSYAGVLKNVKPTTLLTGFPDVNGLPTNKPMMWNGKKMYLKQDTQGSAREWVLVDAETNQVVTGAGPDGEPEQYRTSSINEADSWIRQMAQKKKP